MTTPAPRTDRQRHDEFMDWIVIHHGGEVIRVGSEMDAMFDGIAAIAKRREAGAVAPWRAALERLAYHAEAAGDCRDDDCDHRRNLLHEVTLARALLTDTQVQK